MHTGEMLEMQHREVRILDVHGAARVLHHVVAPSSRPSEAVVTAQRPAGAGGGEASQPSITAAMSSAEATRSMAGLSQRVTDSSPKTARAADASARAHGRSTSRGVRMVEPSMVTR